MPLARSFRWRIIAALIMFLSCGITAVLLLSCSSSQRLSGYVHYRLNANPTTLDPALITDVPSATVAAKLFNGLVRLNEDLSVMPDIASRWEISRDGLVYRFFLKKGVRFSHGREVRAQDFKYSFERILDPKTRSPNTWVFEHVYGAKEFREGVISHVKGFRSIGEDVFEVRLKRPFAPFMSMLSMTPCYVVPHEEVDRKKGDFSSYPIGTGPYVLKEWLPNRGLKLESRPDYFDRGPHVSGIFYRIIPEDLTAITEFELGNIDVIVLPVSVYSKFMSDSRWAVHITSIQGLNTYYLGMNVSRFPFNNPDIRRAVSHALDRQTILKTFYEGRGRLASGPVPDTLRTWSLKRSGLTPLTYDPQQSREILQRFGVFNTAVALYVTADQEVVDLAEIIQSYLRKVGISVTIKQLEWSTFKEAINKGEPDLFWLSWWADYPDPENFLFPLFHSSNAGPAGNRTRYSNQHVDALIEKGQASADVGKQNLSYQEAESIIVNESPWVPFWHKTDYIVKQPWINGFKTYAVYTMDKGTDVWF